MNNEEVTVRARTYYSVSLILAAHHFEARSGEIEKSYSGDYSENLLFEHRGYVTGSVMSTVSFLEAAINELYADTLDNPDAPWIRSLDREYRTMMAYIWKLEVRFPVLTKFQLALTLSRKALFEAGTNPYQDAQSLISLRNALVHYEPEWVTSVSPEPSAVTVTKLQERLEGKFSLNPLTKNENPFFPDKCLGHGCAAWGFAAGVKFANDFFSRMGLTPVYLEAPASRDIVSRI